MMKFKQNKILFLFTFLFVFFYNQSFSIEVDNKKIVQDFINCVKSKDKNQISELILYPLQRHYPLKSINNSDEFKNKFEEIFDSKLIDTIINSNIDKNWNEVGWRGIMLYNGLIWLNSEGKLIALNYESLFETKIKNEIIEHDRNLLNEGLREFIKPILEWETNENHIRIDIVTENTYRFIVWNKDKSVIEKPDLVILNGKCEIKGSCGYTEYIFFKENLKYVCVKGSICDEEKSIEIYENEKLIHKITEIKEK